MIRFMFVLAIGFCLAALSPLQAATPSAKDAQAYIISPKNGEVVQSPVVVRFGLKGMGVAPAGTEKKHTGHHHLMIDLKKLPNLHKPLPSNAQLRHFGGGQTEVTLKLKPGKHRLQIILGDKSHIPHNPVVLSKPITITVK